ncbi:proprotein convertase subtilisin/kexin type 4-like isoform X1 [Ciona intestinalis]
MNFSLLWTWNFNIHNSIIRTLKIGPLYVVLLILCCRSHATNRKPDVYLNEWAVEIYGGNDVADEVAAAHGFINHGLIMQSKDFYRFSHPKLKKRSLDSSYKHHQNLLTNEKVTWAEQQRSKRRVKRDLIDFDPNTGPNDPEWSQMWYLVPTTIPSMRVVEAWNEGYSGKDVSVTILDDGIEHSHPDLHANYDPLASSDINSHDDDPAPRLNPTNENRHGTRCAGEVAAVANNGVCAIGIAFNAKIGGVRMLDGEVTDAVESASIGLRPEHVDIYSASWGPDDDGKTVDGPAKMAKLAFEHGVNQGREGKGSIFVWASGNGGRHQDNCNCDGYTDSIYTLSISSTTQRGTRPWYSEACSSTLAATYSSGRSGDKQIITTDLRHGCTTTHTGTSASAPLAAGICALALEANPNLTWRDMQHLVVKTAKPDGLSVDDWKQNGVGRRVSHAFGYGLMDAYGMVTLARNWTNVPQQNRCNISVISPEETPRILRSTEPLRVNVEVLVGCPNGEAVERLEHVQAELTLRNERRGDLTILLTSPMGTTSQLLEPRRNDISARGFTKWAFMTTHSWDEDPRGTWTLVISDRNQRPVSGVFRPGAPPIEHYEGTLSLFNLVLYGTSESDWQHSTAPVSTTTTTTTLEAPVEGSTTLPPPSTIKTTTTTIAAQGLRNCKTPLSSGKGCTVCARGSYLDPVEHVCLSACPPGHYEAEERVEVSVATKPRGVITPEEISEESSFEDEERFSGYVCRPCASLCHKCNGAKTSDCVQCVAGAQFRLSDNACIDKGLGDPTHQHDTTVSVNRGLNYMYLAIPMAVIAFIGVFIVCQSRTRPISNCLKGSKTQYKYLPSGDGALQDLEEYHDDDDIPPVTTRTTKDEPNVHQNGYSRIQLNGYTSSQINGTQ